MLGFMETPKRPTWTEIRLDNAKTIARRSRCSRAQIGAVIVDRRERIIAEGYNGPAAGLEVDGNCVNWCERAQGKTGLGAAYDGCPSIHAEANALLYVDRWSVEGGSIYVTAPPCMGCAKLISNSGLRTVYCLIDESDYHRDPLKAMQYLETCGLDVYAYNRITNKLEEVYYGNPKSR
jgi:dCMP deaminase